MDVPSSKLDFSKYEIANGLDNGTPMGGATVVNKTEAASAASLFTKKV